MYFELGNETMKFVFSEPDPQILVGEHLPTSGSIWEAAGLRLVYVAQHAFHHFEKHMQETPT